MPEIPFHDMPGHYDNSRDASAIALGIALAVEEEGKGGEDLLTGTKQGDAVLLSVYAAYESGMRICSSGDGGKSLGTFQLQGVSRAIAANRKKLHANGYAERALR